MACGQQSSLTHWVSWNLAVSPPAHLLPMTWRSPGWWAGFVSAPLVSQDKGNLTAVFVQKKYLLPWNHPVFPTDVQSLITSVPALAAARSWAGLSLAGILSCYIWRLSFSHSYGLCHQVIWHQRGLWDLFLDVGESSDFWESQQRHCWLCLLLGGDFYIYFIQMHTVTLETVFFFGCFLHDRIVLHADWLWNV